MLTRVKNYAQAQALTDKLERTLAIWPKSKNKLSQAGSTDRQGTRNVPKYWRGIRPKTNRLFFCRRCDSRYSRHLTHK